MSLKWRGDEVTAKLNRACRLGVDKTIGTCVLYAKQNHPFQNQTGHAERSIKVVEPAVTENGRTYGMWGSTLISYFIYLELGTSRMRPFPTLRPAAAIIYPQLAGNIREAM